MTDLRQLRQVIETTPEGRPAAIVSRKWLEEVEADLKELARLRAPGPARA